MASSIDIPQTRELSDYEINEKVNQNLSNLLIYEIF